MPNISQVLRLIASKQGVSLEMVNYRKVEARFLANEELQYAMDQLCR